MSGRFAIVWCLVFVCGVRAADEPPVIHLPKPDTDSAQPRHRINLAAHGHVKKAAISADGLKAFVQFSKQSEDGRSETRHFVAVDLQQGRIEHDIDWPDDLRADPPDLDRLEVSANGKWLIGSSTEAIDFFRAHRAPDRTRTWVWDAKTGRVLADHQTPEGQWAAWGTTGEPQWLGVLRMASGVRQVQRKAAGQPIGPSLWLERWRLPDLKVEVIGGEQALGLKKATEDDLWQPLGGRVALSPDRPTARVMMYGVFHQGKAVTDRGMWLLEVEPHDPNTVQLTRRREWDLIGTPLLSPSGRSILTHRAVPGSHLVELRDAETNALQFVIDPTSFAQFLNIRWLTDHELVGWAWSNAMQALVIHRVDLERQTASAPLVLRRLNDNLLNYTQVEARHFSRHQMVILVSGGYRKPAELLVFPMPDLPSE